MTVTCCWVILAHISGVAAAVGRSHGAAGAAGADAAGAAGADAGGACVCVPSSDPLGHEWQAVRFFEG